jgi:hypothetical protein
MNDKKNHPSEAQHSTRRDWLRFASLASAGLAARETLPRIGYAQETATWLCP